MRLASPLLTSHTVHWAENDPALPPLVKRFIEPLLEQGTSVTDAFAPVRHYGTQVATFLSLELEVNDEGDETLVAYAQGDTLSQYSDYLAVLRNFASTLVTRIYDANYRGDFPLEAEDSQALEQLSRYADYTGFAYRDGAGVVEVGRRQRASSVLQAHPLSDEQLAMLPTQSLIILTDPTESQQLTSIDPDLRTNGNWSTTPRALAGMVGLRSATILGPVHLTEHAFEAGEPFGSSRVDEAWLLSGQQDLYHEAYRRLRITIHRMRSDHANVLPYCFVGSGNTIIPVDWADDGRLARTLTAFQGSYSESVQNVSRKAAEWVRALFPEKADEIRMKAMQRWLSSRRQRTLARLRQEVQGASDNLAAHQRSFISALRELEEKQQQLAQAESLPDEMDPSELEGLDRLLKRGVLTDFRPGDTSDQFTFTTRELFAYDPRSDLWHKLGAYEVSVNMNPGYGNHVLNIRNVSGLRRDGYDSGMHHPHVFPSGNPCVGNFIELQTDLAMNRDWRTLIDATLAFLESVDVRDTAGRHIHNWPVADDEDQDRLNATHGPDRAA